MSLRTRILVSVFCVMGGVLALLALNLAADALARTARERIRQGELVAAWVQDWILDQRDLLLPLAEEGRWAELARRLGRSPLVADWVAVEPEGEGWVVASARSPETAADGSVWGPCVREALDLRRVVVHTPWVAAPLVFPDGRKIGIALAVPAMGETVPDLGGTLARMAWVMLLGTALLMLVMFILLDRFVLRPMGALVAGAERVARSDFSRPVPAAAAAGEMDALVRSFNGMMARLEEAQRGLRDDIAKAQDRIENTERRLVVAQRLSAVGTLAAGIAHEINNPLGGLINAARMLRERPGADPRSGEYLGLIGEGLERIQETVRKLLQFAPRRFAPTRVDAGDAIARAIALCAHRSRERDVRVESVLEPGLPPLHGDPGEIQQAILNVLINAVDAVGRGTGVVRVSARAADGQIFLTVSDNGRGMDTTTLRRAAEPFYTTKEAGAGTGLGLAVVQSILEHHGGTLGLASEPGRGTEVTLAFPVAGTGPAPEPSAGTHGRAVEESGAGAGSAPTGR
jgi:signal transduction histidine kinase